VIQSIRLMLISAVVLAWGATSLEGAVEFQLFSDRAQFEAATSGWDMEFEGFNEEFDLDYLLEFPGFSLGADPNPLSYTDDLRFVTDGGAVRFPGTWPTQEMTFSFTNPINVFGIDINDWGTTGSGVLEVTNNTGTIDEHLGSVADADHLPLGNTIFFGLIDPEPFNSVSIRATTDGDTVGLDKLSYGGPMVEQIPEPSSWFAWSGLALCGWAFGWRRRKQRAGQPAS